MGKFLGTYDPKEVSLSLGGVNISGFGDGTFITIARTDNETYKLHVGAHGESARTKNNNETGTISNIRSIQITLVAKTSRSDPGYTNTFEYFNLQDEKIFGPANDGFHRRVLSTQIKCRNLGL